MSISVLVDGWRWKITIGKEIDNECLPHISNKRKVSSQGIFILFYFYFLFSFKSFSFHFISVMPELYTISFWNKTFYLQDPFSSFSIFISMSIWSEIIFHVLLLLLYCCRYLSALSLVIHSFHIHTMSMNIYPHSSYRMWVNEDYIHFTKIYRICEWLWAIFYM